MLSYSMYLIHFVFAWDMSKYLNLLILSEILEPELVLAVAYAMSVLGSFYCALIIERLIEKPFIEYGRMLIHQMDKRLAKSQ